MASRNRKSSGPGALRRRLLERRAWRVTTEAEDAAVSGLRPEQNAAAVGLIENLAGVWWNMHGGVMAGAWSGGRARAFFIARRAEACGSRAASQIQARMARSRVRQRGVIFRMA